MTKREALEEAIEKWGKFQKGPVTVEMAKSERFIKWFQAGIVATESMLGKDAKGEALSKLTLCAGSILLGYLMAKIEMGQEVNLDFDVESWIKGAADNLKGESE